jgi:hypothetical protein
LPLTYSNLLLIILSVILINIVAAYPHYHLGQINVDVGRALQSLYDAVTNERGNVGFALLVSSNRDNIIFSERFEGAIKIVGNRPVPSVPTVYDQSKYS